MLTITIDDADALKGLNTLINNAKDSHRMMKSLAEELKTLTTENFESQSFGGQGWQPKAFGKGRTLQDTGELSDSISTKATSTTAQVGTNVVYARIHHFGGTIHAKKAPFLMFKTPSGFARVKSVTIPSRPFLPVSPSGQLQSGADKRLIDTALEALKKGL
ncbi:phage virion morphogenesis protein [Moraxella nasibovis]|uniref:phage virion morphogenesis protein n=1 Tax=Moraxella nasibovis TaxID=2904120 RepID=UPI00240EA98D|nr:phage virion morphogenesis protein [Moraxella nasibovis]WFF39582.1 phage virion morphogenesis protein [Moraxella nasibovis]